LLPKTPKPHIALIVINLVKCYKINLCTRILIETTEPQAKAAKNPLTKVKRIT